MKTNESNQIDIKIVISKVNLTFDILNCFLKEKTIYIKLFARFFASKNTFDIFPPPSRLLKLFHLPFRLSI